MSYNSIGNIIARSKETKDKQKSVRSCGDCIACCVYFEIKDKKLDKPLMKHCPYLTLPGAVVGGMAYYTGKHCDGNCKLHGTALKPDTCVKYECLWLQGYGGEEDRPDKSVIIFDENSDIENAIEAKPLANNIENTEAGAELIEKMSRETGKPVIVLDFYKRKVHRIVGRPTGNE
jgi:hypothetical protein